MKQKIFFTIIILMIIVFSFENKVVAQSANKQKLKTVVIDPGHGGSDPGAVGKISKEKDLVLIISLKFGEYIKKNFPDVNVIYTRTDDRHVELYKRADIANDNNADLFISVHINSVDKSGPYGTETFVMGNSLNAANLEVAKKENAAILKEENYKDNYDGFDPNDPENHIIFSLYQNAYLTQSLLFAQMVQDKFTNSLKRFDRGVKQARFLVLWKTAMPSVLVELGFISNIEEEKYLNSKIGQENLAKALFEAFVGYKSLYEEENVEIKFEYETDDVKPDIVSGKSGQQSIELPEDKENNNAIVVVSTSDINNKPAYAKDQVVYKIQIRSSPKKIELIPGNFKSYENVDVYLHNGLYKYTVGEETDRNKIMDLYKKVKTDYNDCFIVSFKNGERI